MKRIFIYTAKGQISYFSNAKKVYEHCKSKGQKVHRNFTHFKNWIDQQGIYEFFPDPSYNGFQGVRVETVN